MSRIQCKNHKIGTYKINKIFLSCFDDKINILKLLIIRVNYSFLSMRQKLFQFSIQLEQLFLLSYQNIILISALVKTTFLPSYIFF